MTRLYSFLKSRNGNLRLQLHLSVTLGLLFHTVKIVYPMREMSDQVPGVKNNIIIMGLTFTHRPALDPRL